MLSTSNVKLQFSKGIILIQQMVIIEKTCQSYPRSNQNVNKTNLNEKERRNK